MIRDAPLANATSAGVKARNMSMMGALALPTLRMGAGIERLAAYIPPPPSPPSCSGTFRSWCSGEEGQLS
jgi:hypothetical protein